MLRADCFDEQAELRLKAVTFDGTRFEAPT